VRYIHRLVERPRFFSTSAKQALNLHYSKWASNQLRTTAPHRNKICLVQADAAGTVLDPYCIAPFFAFNKLFERRNLHLSHEQITGPMGMKKIEHIKHLLFLELNTQWESLYGRPPNQEDVNLLHEEFIVALDKNIMEVSDPTPNTDLAFNFLQENSILVALTSGYSRKTFDLACIKFNKRFSVATSTTADEVPEGTRFTMLERNMSKLNKPLGLFDQSIFVTDACSDVANVRAAAVAYNPIPWIIGVSDYSTHVGITSRKQLADKTADELARQREHAKQLLLKNGAHAVIHDMAELPLALVAANLALSRGETPKQTARLTIEYPTCIEELSQTYATCLK
jgi:phosphonoacetaldehyde hydrolase